MKNKQPALLYITSQKVDTENYKLKTTKHNFRKIMW